MTKKVDESSVKCEGVMPTEYPRIGSADGRTHAQIQRGTGGPDPPPPPAP